MTLDLASIPLAAVAGALGILSPCVWPLVPVALASASGSGRSGPWLLATGLVASFALGGTLVSWLFLETGVDPSILRSAAAVLLVAAGLALAVDRIGDRVATRLSEVSSRLAPPGALPARASGQLGVGMLLGLVWLPCVGPTLGAAIGLASMGQSLALAFATMVAYGVGTSAMLFLAAAASKRLLSRWRPALFGVGSRGKSILGWTLVVLGLLVLTGADHWLEARALAFTPDWIQSI